MELYRTLYSVGITTVHSGAWGCYTHCWVFLHLFAMDNFVFLAGRSSWYWRIRFGAVPLMYNSGTEETWYWKVLLQSWYSLLVCWTQLFWHSGMITWLALAYCALQWSSRCSIEVGLRNVWQWYNSPFWRFIKKLSVNTFW